MAGLRYIALLAFGIICALAAPAGAQPVLQDTTCMPQVMSVIEAQALLEAEREIIQNQNLIAKPDSVLEYSCFEQHMTLAGQHTGQMFTEREWYYNVDDAFIDQYSLDRGIYYLVYEALVSYLGQNFWHQYLGDRAQLAALPMSPGFSCYAMAYVWNRAKCSNFISPRNAQDGFYTFAEYRDMADPRNLPVPQQCETWEEWADTIGTAQTLSAPVTGPAIVTRLTDSLVRYPEIFDADDCAASPAIPTGVYVPPIAGQDGYEEHVCVAPGCYYDGSGCTR